MLLMLFALPGKVKADDYWINNVNNKITVGTPYLHYSVMIYDANGTDSFFDTWDNPSNYPHITVDNVDFSNRDLWWLLCWDKWDRMCDQIQRYNGWVPDKVWTKDGITLAAWDPHVSNDRMYVDFVVFFDEVEVGKTHTFKINGRWKWNRGNPYWNEKTRTSEATEDPFAQFGSISRIADNTMQYTGSINKYSNSTCTLGFFKNSQSSPNKVNNNDKYLVKEFATNATSAGSDTKWTVDNNSSNKNIYPIFWQKISKTIDGKTFAPIIFKKYNAANVAGYAYPTKLEATYDMWKKRVELKWTKYDTDKNTAGKWSVYRRKADDVANNRKLIKSDIAYTTDTYTDTDSELEYDTDYIYEIVFVPNNYDKTTVAQDLTYSVKTNIKREFEFTKLNVESGEKALTFSWENPVFKGTGSYSFTILRSENGGEWEELETIPVTDKTRTSYSYVDSKARNSCSTYKYKVRTIMLEGKVFEPNEKALPSGNIWGSSGVSAVSATKGDYSGMVKVSWDAIQIGTSTTKYELFRRIIGSNSSWASIYKTSGTTDNYFFEDNTALPGQFYEYKVESSFLCDGKYTDPVALYDQGFCRTTGIISGRIYYDTGTAVPDVKVSLIKDATSEVTTSQFYSLATNGNGDGVSLDLTADELKDNFTTKAFTAQMFVRPNRTQTGTTPVIFDMAGKLKLVLGSYSSSKKGFLLSLVHNANGTETKVSSGQYLPADQFTSVTLAKTAGNVYTLTLIDSTNVRTKSFGKIELSFENAIEDEKGISYGGALNSTDASVFLGYIDEMRMFSGKALTKEEIQKNFNHILTGTEDGLFLYWPVDEGLDGLTTAFDYSKTAGVANGHHGTFGVSTRPTSAILPKDVQLSLFAYTDVQGNYVIRGVPFTGEGTNYTVRPTLGVHEFSPNYSSRYVSASSLIHNSVDFLDVSSFKVSGFVYYENTTYPVEGCNLYVDGSICSKDGNIIATDDKGRFEISVPIGEHFISIEKNGHTFLNNGRYPADPNNVGTRYVFDREITNLEFTDNTLVNITGRIVGGSIEGKKQIGFGLSENNIGVTELILTPMNDSYRMNVVKVKSGTAYTVETNTETLPIGTKWDKIASNSWRGAGDNNKKFYIRTDANTGEFSAMVPPLVYKVESIKTVGDGKTVGDPCTVDVSNPTTEYTDTLWRSTVDYDIYYYNGIIDQTYHSDPVFTVEQNGDGSFGIDSYTFTDDIGKATVKDIYTVGTKGVTYKYGAPLFVKGDTYIFDIYGYEKYVNADTKKESIVPLSDIVVTIENALSDKQPVYIADMNGSKAGEVAELESNQIMLDSLGKAKYIWNAGLPNITPPYSRTISMSYDIDGRTYQWSGSGMKGVILGSLITGSNFVTSGPDVVTMVLRDPPGTNSYAEWTNGTSTTKITTEGNTRYTDQSTSITFKLGSDLTVATGAPLGGVLKMNSIDNVDDLETGVHMTVDYQSDKSTTLSTTNTTTIATSDAPEFVGAIGDVFVGTATNILYGTARDVGLHRVAGTTNQFELNLEDIITTGLKFKTAFNYTQNYIENVLIPSLEKLKETKLQYMSASKIASYVNNTDHMIYLTSLKPGSKGYGTSNMDKSVWGKDASTNSLKGKSYTCVAPKNKTQDVYEDSVVWIITQIENWKKVLETNEKEKVLAFEDRDKYLDKNISFDCGTKVSYSKETTSGVSNTTDLTVAGGAILNNTLGFRVNSTGMMWSLNIEAGGGTHEASEETNDTTTVFSYYLAEDGDDDALTVDVYNYGQWGPIFRTRGGQTSGPYEGEVTTKYYHPGEVIMEATQQIEVPHITVDVPTVVDVPSGSAANYTLRLTNASEIDEDVYYKLLMIDESNPNGAQISIDGMVLTDNRVIKIPAGETITKSLQLRQTNTSVLQYDKIGIVLASQSQYDPTSTWDQIADTVYITAQFVPSSSDVKMSIDHDIINTSTGTDLTIKFSDFDRNYNNLKAFRIQYRTKGDTSWTLLREYVLDSKNKTASNEMLPSGASVSYTLPMVSYPDGEYTFRVLSVATYGTSEVTRATDEMTVVKDVARPRPLVIPSPTDGILNADDEISILFNEDVLTNKINATDNFVIQGDLNDAAVGHDGVFAVSGSEGAKTTTSIDLSNRSFAFNFWLKWTKYGTIISHGTEASPFSIAINSSSKLVITNGTKTHTSTKTVPKNTWCYVGVIYDYNDGEPQLTATLAYDKSTVELFKKASTAEYSGKGNLVVGSGISAAIHEISLWNYARSFDEAQSTMYKGKSASTDGLIGYWKLNEGYGAVGSDRARSRHLTLPSEGCWQMANSNVGLKLDGKSYAGFNVSSATATKDDDWMVEFWMKGSKPTANASIFSYGNSAIDLYATTTGALAMDVNGTTYSVAPAGYLNNSWHHVALNVMNGTNGSATVYIDGNPVCQLAASLFPALQSDRIFLGAKRTYADNAYTYSKFFKGTFDEFRYWRGTVSKASMIDNMHNRLTGSEPGIAAYYPFESMELDQYNQIVVSKDKKDHAAGSTVTAEIFTPANGGGSEPAWESTDAPALKTAPSAENLKFSFVANERQIVINLEDDPARLEGSTVTIKVRAVTDKNGNECLPITWTAYVKQNRLEWADSEIAVRKEGTKDVTFTAEFANASGSTENWYISNLPVWLKANTESGVLGATGNKTIKFTVDGSTAVGNYEAIVMLTGNNGVSSPLVINLTSASEKPNWTVAEGDYEDKMNVIGKISINGIVSEDSEDLIAAFIDGECRGVASPNYFSRYNGSFVMLDIFGNPEDESKDIVFKIFDNSTGTIYPHVVSQNDIDYMGYSIIGKITDPVLFTTDSRQEQNTELRKGWNWISLYVSADDMTPKAVFSQSPAVSYVKDKSSFASTTDGIWRGSLSSMAIGNMYRVKADAATSMSFIGNPVDATKSPITINSGWNWIGFNGTSYMNVDEAFAGLEPQDGDVVNSLNGFSMYDDYCWIGTLNTLVPGQGYAYHSTATTKKSFTYPKSSSTSQMAKVRAKEYDDIVDINHAYSSTMCIIAQVMDGDEMVEDATIIIKANDEDVRGRCESSLANALYFINADGEGSDTYLNFNVVSNNKVYTFDINIPFDDKNILGSVKAPFTLNLNNATSIRGIGGIDSINDNIYDITGRKIESINSASKGIYIINGKKVRK